ncbi:MAG: carbohydrate ABC transporter permease [Oscillospiraceae bacterium]|nr:carbohydrate ABC transporter permease [Oscillospiraceae bacterium]
MMQRKGKRLARKPFSQKIVYTIAWTVLALYTAYVLFFFLFGALLAIRPNMAEFTIDRLHKDLLSIPENATLKNFLSAFNELGKINAVDTFWTITWNSIWRTTISAVLAVGSCAMVCYILVFYRCRFTRLLYSIGIVVAILPLYGSAGSIYRLYDEMGLINNPLILITSVTLYGANFFYMHAFFKSLSWEYAEAAFIDGASHYQVFFKVMLPMAKPSISALFIMQFISGWNDYESTLLYMQDYPNLSFAVYAYEEVGKYMGNIPAYFAGVLISLVPILILFVLFQNTIMEKVHLGGLKG